MAIIDTDRLSQEIGKTVGHVAGDDVGYIHRALELLLKPDEERFSRVVQLLVDAIAEEEAKRVQIEQTFDLIWNAEMRAIKLWQADHPGHDLEWPDKAKLVLWLLERIDELEDTLDWYADPVLPYALTQWREPRSAVHADKGQRARKALHRELDHETTSEYS